MIGVVARMSAISARVASVSTQPRDRPMNSTANAAHTATIATMYRGPMIFSSPKLVAWSGCAAASAAAQQPAATRSNANGASPRIRVRGRRDSRARSDGASSAEADVTAGSTRVRRVTIASAGFATGVRPGPRPG
jgi:hypothetical protein